MLLQLLPIVVGLVVVGAFLLVSYLHKLSTYQEGGFTTEVTGLGTYLVGALVYHEHYWIATTLVARGHEVTVLARSGPGLAGDERVPGGYRIIRVPVSAVDGLPLPRWARDTIARSRARRRGHAGPTAAARTARPPNAKRPVPSSARVKSKWTVKPRPRSW